MRNTLELDEHQAHVVREFIEANWGQFEVHADAFADADQTGEQFANEILIALGGEA